MQQGNQAELWTLVGRSADIIGIIVGLFGIPAIVVYLRRMKERFLTHRRIEATPLGVNSGFKGLICPVSAPYPPSQEPARQPQAITKLINENDHPPETLWETPIGSALKAIRHHAKDLKYCWLVASEDSAPYLKALIDAIEKYFPNVTPMPPVIVPDVYGKIDDVYEAVHNIFNSCSSDTQGKLGPADIITDVTGGTKIMSIAMAMACLDADRHIEYVEQRERKTFYKIDITYEKIMKRPAEGKQQL
jgi:hypothetical protein